MTNRSIRTIHMVRPYSLYLAPSLFQSLCMTTAVLVFKLTAQELQFLADSSLLNQSQLSAITALLPSPSSSSSVRDSVPNIVANNPPSEQQTNTYYQPIVSPAPPPAYAQPTALTTASSIYAYAPTDAGDLALLPNDRVQIYEYMNSDWAKGRNERTGQEGIFPRSYVNIIDEKNRNQGSIMVPAPPTPQQGNNYGNMPLAVSQSGGGAVGPPSKVEENGKKFGKKLGNAGTSKLSLYIRDI